jgi:anti-anti-sigma factor
MTFRVKEQVIGATHVVSAVGELDGGTADRLRAAVDRALDALPALVVVDLSGVTFIDSAGVRAVLDRRTVMSAMDTQLRVVAAGEQVRTVFALSGRMDGTVLHRTLDEALGQDAAHLAGSL